MRSKECSKNLFELLEYKMGFNLIFTHTHTQTRFIHFCGALDLIELQTREC